MPRHGPKGNPHGRKNTLRTPRSLPSQASPKARKRAFGAQGRRKKR